jgi:hypothetical protein
MFSGCAVDGKLTVSTREPWRPTPDKIIETMPFWGKK